MNYKMKNFASDTKKESTIKEYSILKIQTPESLLAVRVEKQYADNEKRIADKVRSVLCLYNDVSIPTIEEWKDTLSFCHFIIKGGKMIDL